MEISFQGCYEIKIYSVCKVPRNNQGLQDVSSLTSLGITLTIKCIIYF